MNPGFVVVSRDKWLRGDSRTSKLLDSKGHMCCLGFLGKACGARDSELLLENYPSRTTFKGWPSYHWGPAITLNDNAYCAEPVREQELITIFKKQRINLYFVDTHEEAEALRQKLGAVWELSGPGESPPLFFASEEAGLEYIAGLLRSALKEDGNVPVVDHLGPEELLAHWNMLKPDYAWKLEVREVRK